MNYANLYNNTPQTQQLNKNQVENNAGGYVFAISKWSRLERFLILGSDSNTYYQDARELTRENGNCAIECYEEDADQTASIIADISFSGRAPKNSPAIFALALGASHSDLKVRQAALAVVPNVCRTATHLFEFVSYVRKLGKGWGRALKRAVADWYSNRDANALAYQAIKYKNRHKYSHKRLLQTSHPSDKDEGDRKALYRWICEKDYDAELLPPIVKAHLEALKASDKEIINLVKEHNLPWEALPTSTKKNPDVWKALIPGMGLTSLIRNLGAMTAYDALKPLEQEISDVAKKLNDTKALKKARIHPFNVLVAHNTYASGRGFKGSLSWRPIPQVQDALEECFYKSFDYVEPTGKRILVAVDVSGSMTWSYLINSTITAMHAAIAMAMTIVRTEPNYYVTAFSHHMVDLPITARSSFSEVVNMTQNISFGGTDCALPMIHALRNNLNVDAFIVLTDNETYFGNVHPAVQALGEYRNKTGINSKLIVCGMTSTGFSIADPNDEGMLDIVGFDSACPALISDFIKE